MRTGRAVGDLLRARDAPRDRHLDHTVHRVHPLAEPHRLWRVRLRSSFPPPTRAHELTSLPLR